MMVHTELHELFTLPILITHYIAHKKQNPEQDILQFLQEHYSDQEHTHSNSNTHKQLPFKHDKIFNTIYIPFFTIFCACI